MPSLQQRLAALLGEVLSIEQEADGALTVRHDGTFASLRVVEIVEGLELVSLNQMLAWDLPVNKKIRDQIAEHAHNTSARFGDIGGEGQRGGGETEFGSHRRRDAALQLSRHRTHRRRAAHPDPDGARQRRRNPPRAHRLALHNLTSRLSSARKNANCETLPSISAQRRVALPSSRPALRAGAEDFDGMADVGEPVLGGHFGGPRLDLAVTDLHGGSAAAADQVMVMVI